jgi:hypothetical protein
MMPFLYLPDYHRPAGGDAIEFPAVMYDYRYHMAFTKKGEPRLRLRRTRSQWRAVGWNYAPIIPFDMWCDIGCPHPMPRIFDTPEWARDI